MSHAPPIRHERPPTVPLTESGLPDRFAWLAPCYDLCLGLPDTRRLRRFLRPLPTHRLLDLGGGTGRNARVIAGLFRNTVVCDLSRPMLRKALGRNLPPVAADAARLPFADGAFDRVLVVDAFHHFARHPDVAAECHRVLAPGGRLVIEEPDIRRRSVRVVALMERVARMGSRFLPPEELLALLSGAGFRAAIAESDPFRVWITGDRMS